jgi:hypothetical protein
MRNSALPAEKSAGTEDVLTALPSDAHRLGIDCEGAVHYFSRIAETVAVIASDDTVQWESLAQRPLQAWISYVADERGWETLRYVDAFADLFDRLEVA